MSALQPAFMVGAPELTPDIYPPFFDWILQQEPFTLWQTGDQTWQLRVVGSPGSGKSTLSALALERLRALHKSNMPVATIFVQQSAQNGGEKSFLVDLLNSIHTQLDRTDPRTNGAWKDAQASIENRHRNPEIDKRLADCRSSLHTLLQTHGPAFLIIDDLDQCGYKTSLLVESELTYLQKAGLRIMVTSRIPFQRSTLAHSCDIESCEFPRNLAMWNIWKCRKCYDEEEDKHRAFTICRTCREERHGCNKCADFASNSGREAIFFEFCNLVETALDDIPLRYMEDFVAWSLQSEHGHLNIGPPRSEFPPLSALGWALLTSDAALSLIQETARKAANNVALAKLRLDDIHSAVALEDTEGVVDRLPRNIVALFDAGISQVRNQLDSVASLGLKVIVLGMISSNGAFEDVEEELRFFVAAPEENARTLEEVLYACRGFLAAKPHVGEELDAYHPDFGLYVTEDYNKYLFQERQAVQLRRISRSRTTLDAEQKPGRDRAFVNEKEDSKEEDSEEGDSVGDASDVGNLPPINQRQIGRPPIKRSTWS